jgi:hypothetical protein
VFEWPASVFKRCPFWGLLTGFGVRGGTRSRARMVHHRNGDPSPLQANTTMAGQAAIWQAKEKQQYRPSDRYGRLTCGKRRRRRAGMKSPARARPWQPHHGAYSSGKHGDELPLQPGSPRSSVAAQQNRPDDLATELNPHETELNPIRQSRRLAAPGRSKAAPFRARRIAHGHAQLARAEPAIASPAIRGTRDAPPPPLA